MIDIGAMRNWIYIAGVAFLGILGGLAFANWVGPKNWPIISTLANGAVTSWKAAA